MSFRAFHFIIIIFAFHNVSCPFSVFSCYFHYILPFRAFHFIIFAFSWVSRLFLFLRLVLRVFSCSLTLVSLHRPRNAPAEQHVRVAAPANPRPSTPTLPQSLPADTHQPRVPPGLAFPLRVPAESGGVDQWSRRSRLPKQTRLVETKGRNEWPRR